MEVLRDNYNAIILVVLTILIIKSLVKLQLATRVHCPSKTKLVQKGSTMSIKGI